MAASRWNLSTLSYLFVVLIVTFSFIGCSRTSPNLPQTAVANQSGNGAAITPTVMPVPPTPQPTATESPTPTATASPTPNPTATATQAPTLVPTITNTPIITRAQQRPVATIVFEAEPSTVPTTTSSAAASITTTITTTVATAAITETLDTADLVVQPATVAAVENNVEASAESISQAGFSASAGSFDEMDGLFQQVRREVDQYAAAIEDLSVEDCRELNNIYERIVSSPQFSPPEYRKQAYISYLSAINSMKGGGQKLTAFCSDYLVSAANAVVPGDASTAVVIGTSKSDYLINQAITQLQVFPVTANIVEANNSEIAGFWEISLTFSLDQGVSPYAARVGGFLRQEGNRITILHTCSRDFVDHVSVTDANGQYFRSGKLSASRVDYC